MESYPEQIQIRLDDRERSLRQTTLVQGKDGITVQYVIDESRRWKPGSTLRVAFSGGTDELRQRIEAVAKEWRRYANIALDFREKNRFREWSTSDSDYKAEIRIGFESSGYWSMIGRDSVNALFPNERSMNFEGLAFDLPKEDAATVRHEFGHAFGFKHEHQHPKEGCDAEFRWVDEPGYIFTQDEKHRYISDCNGKDPGLYTVLGGAPEYWCKEKVDYNLEQLAESHAYKTGPFDVKSIMKYYFPEWMFVKGKQSRCYDEENFEISDGDKKGAASVYPRSAQEVKSVLAEQKRVLDAALRAQGLSPQLEQEFRIQSDSLRK